MKLVPIENMQGKIGAKKTFKMKLKLESNFKNENSIFV